MEFKTQRVSIECAGGNTLAARLEQPAEPPRAYALFAHCFACSKDVFAASRISRELARHGIAVLRFDFTGLGNSDGDFANTNFSSNIQDLVAAADFLRNNYQAPSILIGHSLGGAAVLAAAEHVPERRAVVTIGAPFDPAHVTHLLGDSLDTIEEQGHATITIAGSAFTIKHQFVLDLQAQSQSNRIAHLDAALLILHAPLDEVVALENARLIYDAAKHPKSFVSLDGADHLIRKREDATYVATVLGAWVERYLPMPEVHPRDASAEHLVKVTETRTGRYLQAVDVGDRHELLADEPEHHGGEDLGPNPYDLLLAGLGACTNMTLRMYAERKGWPVDRVTTRLTHQKIHAEDCQVCETKTGKIDYIQREVRIEGPLTDEQRNRMLQIANKCPVHRTLHSENHIVTRFAE